MEQGTNKKETVLCLPRYGELTSLPLYMDQVTLVIGDALAPVLWGEDRAVTPAMINNYVKQKMIAAPVKKKYGREQLARLIELSVLKQALSMQEIQVVLAAMDASYGEEVGYDSFCERMEDVWSRVVGGETVLVTREQGEALALLDAAIIAVTGKMLLRSMINDSKVDE